MGDPFESSLVISRSICAWILANSSSAGVDVPDGSGDSSSSDRSDRLLYGSLNVDVVFSCCPRYWLSTK